MVQFVQVGIQQVDIQYEMIKEDKHMGITAKSCGKFKSIMKKMENQLEAERKAAKEKKEVKKSKTNISKQQR